WGLVTHRSFLHARRAVNVYAVYLGRYKLTTRYDPRYKRHRRFTLQVSVGAPGTWTGQGTASVGLSVFGCDSVDYRKVVRFPLLIHIGSISITAQVFSKSPAKVRGALRAIWTTGSRFLRSMCLLL